MNFNEAKISFLTHCKYEKNLSPKTIKAYELDSKQFSNFLDEKFSYDVNIITKFEIRNYLRSLRNYEVKTIKRKIATIKALFNFLEFEDVISINPFRKLKINLKETRQLPSLMDTTEVRKILQVAYNSYRDSLPGTFKAILTLRDVVVLELLFATGIRVSELCNLKVKDVDLDSGNVLILGKGRKERIIQVCNQETLDLLKLYRTLVETGDKAQNESFFKSRLNNTISDQSIRYMIKKYYLKAGIKKHITPHTFRHTFATLLLEEDVDIKYIQHLLGHSNISITQIYTHVNKKKQRRILLDKHPRSKFRLGIENLE